MGGQGAPSRQGLGIIEGFSSQGLVAEGFSSLQEVLTPMRAHSRPSRQGLNTEGFSSQGLTEEGFSSLQGVV